MITRLTALSFVVMPSVEPTVPTAEQTSNRISLSVNGSIAQSVSTEKKVSDR